MREYILIYIVNGGRPHVLPDMYSGSMEALGAALVELNRLMAEKGFANAYTMLPPYRAGDTVNLTAQSAKTNGYPEQICIDLYVQPVIIDEDLAGDFNKGAKHG